MFKGTFVLNRRMENSSANAKREIYFVSDDVDWAYKWEIHNIRKNLADEMMLKTYLIKEPWKIKGQIIHFIDRYKYFYGPFRKLHPSNYAFLTWFHGDPASPNYKMRELCRILPEAAKYLHKIIISCGISKTVLTGLGIAEDKLALIPIGVDLQKFRPVEDPVRLGIKARLGIPKSAFCIGSFQKDGIGWEEGLEPKLEKGPDVFLRVMERLIAAGNNIFVVLTGPARGYVKKGLDKIGVPYLHNHLSNHFNIIEYYQALDLYLITSRDEGGPKGLIESWATGVPVVSTRVGMAADLIRHGKNGMISESDNIEKLTHYVEMLIGDGALRERIRLQALRDVKRYDWPLIAAEYHEKLYRPCLT